MKISSNNQPYVRNLVVDSPPKGQGNSIIEVLSSFGNKIYALFAECLPCLKLKTLQAENVRLTSEVERKKKEVAATESIVEATEKGLKAIRQKLEENNVKAGRTQAEITQEEKELAKLEKQMKKLKKHEKNGTKSKEDIEKEREAINAKMLKLSQDIGVTQNSLPASDFFKTIGTELGKFKEGLMKFAQKA